jgi:hypothetical protein
MLRHGIDRVIGEQDNGWLASPNEYAAYTFASPVHLSSVRLTFDSDQADTKRMPCWYPKEGTTVEMPAMLPRSFAIDVQSSDGLWQRAHLVENNYQRLVRLPLNLEAKALRFVSLDSWGGEQAHIMAFEAC